MARHRRRRSNFAPTVHWWLRQSRRFACGSIFRDRLAQLAAARKSDITCPTCLTWLASHGCLQRGQHVWPINSTYCFCEQVARKRA